MDDHASRGASQGVCIAEHSGPKSQMLALLFSRCAQEARRAVGNLDEAFAEITERAGGRTAADPPLAGAAFDALASATRKASRSVEDFKLIEARVTMNLEELGPELTYAVGEGIAELRAAMRGFAAALGLRPRDAITVPLDEARASVPPPDFTALPACLGEIVVRWSFARSAMLDRADSMEAIFRLAWRRHLERVVTDE